MARNCALPIPALTADGYLPPGVHLCTLAEIQSQFAPPGVTTQRRRVYDAVAGHMRDPMVARYVAEVYIDGSFVTEKREPGDVDLVIGLHPGSMRAILTRTGGVLDPAAVMEHLSGLWAGTHRGKPLLHGFVDDVGGPIFAQFVRYFQQSDRRDEPDRKGILRLERR
jgi:hypothetical protein